MFKHIHNSYLFYSCTKILGDKMCNHRNFQKKNLGNNTNIFKNNEYKF